MGCPGLSQRQLSGGQMLFPLRILVFSWKWSHHNGNAVVQLGMLFIASAPSLGFETHQTECAALNVELILENPLAGAAMCRFWRLVSYVHMLSWPRVKAWLWVTLLCEPTRQVTYFIIPSCKGKNWLHLIISYWLTLTGSFSQSWTTSILQRKKATRRNMRIRPFIHSHCLVFFLSLKLEVRRDIMKTWTFLRPS